jgi:hypothetical protein
MSLMTLRRIRDDLVGRASVSYANQKGLRCLLGSRTRFVCLGLE